MNQTMDELPTIILEAYGIPCQECGEIIYVAGVSLKDKQMTCGRCHTANCKQCQKGLESSMKGTGNYQQLRCPECTKEFRFRVPWGANIGKLYHEENRHTVGYSILSLVKAEEVQKQ